ncbi:MAG: tetratricopeptide repeat protein [Nitrospinae bacterium]|nr:tetratricopeptide repeat protein [Nitrospinota bacterium]
MAAGSPTQEPPALPHPPASSQDFPLDPRGKPLGGSGETFSPFEKERSSPLYFPDAVEKAVEEALIEGYLEDREAILARYRSLLAQDQELEKAGKPITGLSDNLLDLANGMLEGRDAHQRALEASLKAPYLEPELEARVRYRIKNDEFNRAQGLLKGDKTNKTGNIANSFLRPLNMAAWSFGFFIPAVIDTVVYSILSYKRQNQLTDREKMALVDYQAFVSRYPDSRQSRSAEEKAARILAKKAEHDSRLFLEAGKSSLKEGDYRGAVEAFQEALKIQPNSRDASRQLTAAQGNRAQQEREKQLTLSATADLLLTDPSTREPGLKEGYEDLLYAFYSKDARGVFQQEEELRGRYPDGPLADEASYLMAKAYDQQKEYDHSRSLLGRLARQGSNSNMSFRAQLVLSQPPYDWKEEVKQVEREQRRERLRYVLLGEHFAKDNAALGTSELAMEGANALETMGIFNVMAIGYRTLTTLLQGSSSPRKTIEIGEAYLNRFPGLASSEEIHRTLAQAYRKEGNLEKAMEHDKLAGKELTEEEKAKNREKLAGNLLEYAGEKAEGKAEKRLYLEEIMKSYPETQAARKATPELVKILREEEGLLRISKEELKRNPDFYGANGINIKPELLDEDLRNREIADQGITFIAEDLLKICYQAETGPQEKFYPVDKDIFRRLQILLLQQKYRTALTREGEPNRQGDKFFYEFGGDLSAKDVNLEGKLLFKEKAGIALGADSHSPHVGLQLPLPLLDKILPLNFRLNIRPQGVTLDPTIRHQDLPPDKAYLYRE